MSKWCKAMIGGLVLTLLISFCGFAGQCEGIRRQVVRLHILANSDSEQDQALKLKVRDAVIEAGDGLLSGVQNREQALSCLQAALPMIQKTAEQTVAALGHGEPITVSLTTMYFNTRTYDTGTFPAGMYDAIRITIGEGKGKNWWCVMYPPLCVGAATDTDTVLTDSQETVIHGGQRYAVRFKVLEWWESLCSLF